MSEKIKQAEAIGWKIVKKNGWYQWQDPQGNPVGDLFSKKDHAVVPRECQLMDKETEEAIEWFLKVKIDDTRPPDWKWREVLILKWLVKENLKRQEEGN